MIPTEQIINDLETVKRVPQMFINPVTPEMLFCYLSGLRRGVLLSQNNLTFHDFVEAYQMTIQNWKIESASIAPYIEFRKKGMTEKQILKKMLEIEIETYQILCKLGE